MNKIMVIVSGAVALIAYLLFPYMSIMGISMNFIELVDLGGEVGFLDVLPIIAAIVMIVTGAINKRKIALGFSIAGLVSMLAQFGAVSEKFAQFKLSEISVFDFFGMGFWLAFIFFIVGIVFSSLKDKQ